MFEYRVMFVRVTGGVIGTDKAEGMNDWFIEQLNEFSEKGYEPFMSHGPWLILRRKR